MNLLNETRTTVNTGDENTVQKHFVAVITDLKFAVDEERFFAGYMEVPLAAETVLEVGEVLPLAVFELPSQSLELRVKDLTIGSMQAQWGGSSLTLVYGIHGLYLGYTNAN